MAVEFRKGDRVYSPRFGRGEVLAVWDGRMTLRFDDGSELKVQDAAAIRLERLDAPQPVGGAVVVAGSATADAAGATHTADVASAVRNDGADRAEEATVDPDPMRAMLTEVLEEILGPSDARIADRWKGGTLVMKPGREGTLEKEIPLESFFQKITRVRDQLRVLEQKVNAHAGLSAEDKIALQQYVTRCYGSLTTFNVLFKDAGDRFVGGGSGA